jgi:hypothetical protein
MAKRNKHCLLLGFKVNRFYNQLTKMFTKTNKCAIYDLNKNQFSKLDYLEKYTSRALFTFGVLMQTVS